MDGETGLVSLESFLLDNFLCALIMLTNYRGSYLPNMVDLKIRVFGMDSLKLINYLTDALKLAPSMYKWRFFTGGERDEGAAQVVWSPSPSHHGVSEMKVEPKSRAITSR